MKKKKRASRIKSIIRYRKPRPDIPPKRTAYVDPFYGTQKIGTLPDDRTFFQSLRLRMGGSNEIVRPYEQHAWVRGCINAIANNISGVPFKLYTGETKNPKEIEQGELYDLFQNPNPLMTKTQLWQATLIYLESKGECIWLKDMPPGEENNVAAIPLGIYPRSPEAFEPITKNDVFVGWMYKDGKKEVPLMLAQVIQFKYFNPYNYYRGLSPVSAAMMGINQDYNAARYNLAFYENSADPGGIITYDPGMNKEGLTDDQRDAIRENWEDRHKGTSRANRIAILEGGLKYTPNDVSHADMQHLEGRRYNREEIMMVFGTNKFVMTVYEDLNFATAKVAAEHFWLNTLIPKMNYLEDVLEAKFFKHFDKGIYWSNFDTSKVKALQEDYHKKVETAHKMWEMGFPPNNINEKMALGMKEITWGNTTFVSMTKVPAESLLDATPASIEEESIKTKQTTAVDYDKFWVRYVKKILDPNEKRFQIKIKGYFYRLRTDQLERLAEAEKSVQKVEAFELDSILFVQEEWDKKLKDMTRPLYENIMVAAGTELAEELGSLFQFDLTDPAMLRFMNKKLSKIVGVNDTIRIQLRETLMEGITLKETIGELQGRVRTVFNFSSNRSLTIARTETAITSSGTRFLAMQQEGIKFHRWVTAGDEAVRTTHAAQNGIVKPVGRKFPNGLLAPSDINGSAGEVINCFIDGKIKIFTDKGFKPIRNIKRNDLVLTHQGKFKPVIKTFKGRLEKDSEVIRICTPIRPRGISVTPEHRFLTSKGWVEAKDLTTDDRLIIMANDCPQCGEKKPYYREFCSHSCLSKSITKRQWSNSKHRENMSRKTSAQLKKEYANGTRNKYEIVKKARSVCFKKYGQGGYLKHDPSVHEKAKLAIIKKYGSVLEMLKKTSFKALGEASWHGSSIEKSMGRWLAKTDRDFIRQFVVGRRRVDFYIPTERLFIECDTLTYHNDMVKERQRDLEILLQHPNNRIAHVHYDGCKKGNTPRWEFFDLKALNHTGTYAFMETEIKKVERYKTKKSKPLYNFSVQDDESYLVWGMVSHNCRCLAVAVVKE